MPRSSKRSWTSHARTWSTGRASFRAIPRPKRWPHEQRHERRLDSALSRRPRGDTGEGGALRVDEAPFAALHPLVAAGGDVADDRLATPLRRRDVVALGKH